MSRNCSLRQLGKGGVCRRDRWLPAGDPVWLDRAGSLLDVALDRFGDGDGGFHDTADDATLEQALTDLAKSKS